MGECGCSLETLSLGADGEVFLSWQLTLSAISSILPAFLALERKTGNKRFFPFMSVVSVRIFPCLSAEKNADKNRRACFKCGQHADIIIHDAYRHESKKCQVLSTSL